MRLLKTFFKNSRDAFLHGKAFKKMERGNYLGAAKILENICRDNKDDENMEYTYFSIGRCYFELGKNVKALNWFSKSYDLYQKKIAPDSDARYRIAYRDLISVYCRTLERDGKSQIAKDLISEIDFGR